ncbi:unnamed protein product [Soboliphyme baturini]|uniref:F-box domain-containing protein n=1 Tax=Soboliphyme baturini TaxID=241478 RepID=A0A183IXH0_9BILA|nr:unnamed protein product [Soboliphyme baturini]
MDQLPDEMLMAIFQYLDFKSRLKASAVCWKWHTLLQVCNVHRDDVAVVNVFGCKVWDVNIDDAAKERLGTALSGSADQLVSIPKRCSSLKIWFDKKSFVSKVLKVLAGNNMKTKCLDLYPYDDVLPLNIVKKHFPDLEALILRPHSTEFFWTGMDMPYFPNFSHLKTLILENVTLCGTAAFPPSLRQLEWHHRDDSALEAFMDKVSACRNLQCLMIAYVHFDASSLTRLLSIFTQLKFLRTLGFKFVRFPVLTQLECGTNSPPIKILKLDSCYGNIRDIVTMFRNFIPVTLSFLSINTILEENQLSDINSLVPSLARQNILLHLGIMQRITG